MRRALVDSLEAYASATARLAVALSGGLDSTVLLHALAGVADSARPALCAVHVHHGLSPNADRWAAACAALCAAQHVRLVVQHVDVVAAPGESLEARARSSRYDALARSDADIVVLAHHADDQAETLLLQLMRGAGPHGLAAMPAFRPGAPALLRPFLDLPRRALADYARAHALEWIEDEANDEIAFRRNAIRHRVSPQLRAAFPGYPETLVRAARVQADAARLLDDIAREDLQAAHCGGGLRIAALASLSAPRARNLLRAFLRHEGLRAPSQRRLEEMLRQLVHASPDARIAIAHEGAILGRHRGVLLLHAAAEPFAVAWRGEARLAVPGGELVFEPVHGAGLAARRLEAAQVHIRSRAGGETMRVHAARMRRRVKHMLQEADIPEWQRRMIPFVWCDGALAAVPGVGIACEFAAGPGEPGLEIHWSPGFATEAVAGARSRL